MATIDPQRFDGTRGLHVQADSGSQKGVLDPDDVVVDAGGHRVAWDNQDYKDARTAFVSTEGRLNTYKSTLQGIQKALDAPGGSKPSEKDVKRVLDGATDVSTNASAAQRSDAYALMAWCEGIEVQHYTMLPWNKIDPGKRAISDLQQALRLNPHNGEAAYALTQALLGIRNSSDRARAEKYLAVDANAMLADLLPLLEADHGDLRTQTALAHAMDSLARDNRLPARYANKRESLDQHIKDLRAASPDQAKLIDESDRRLNDAK